MAIINVDDAYILNETGAQVDKTTGIPFKNESLTEAEAAQARANIRAGGTNPNLLDNPFFTINQRGFTGGSTVGYTVDRWKNDNGSAITFSGGVIGLPANAVFIQPIEPDLYAELVGKTVTLSVLYSDGTIASGTITVPSSGSTYATGTPRLAMNGTSKRFFCYPPTSISVKAFKIELGTVSTLANDTPPKYAEELTRCKYYFERIKSAKGAWQVVGQGLADQASRAIILVPMTPKRTGSFTISVSGSWRIINTSNITSATFSAASAQPSNGVAEIQASASSLTVGALYYLGANNDANAYIDISADL